MASDNTNRKEIREAVAALLETALTGDGKPVQAVYAYRKDFAPESPVVLVLSAGSDRQKVQTFSGTTRSDLRFEILTFVLDADENASWSEQDADDHFDLVEKMLTDVIDDNFKGSEWQTLLIEDGFSDILNVVVGGKPYLMEQMFIITRV